MKKEKWNLRGAAAAALVLAVVLGIFIGLYIYAHPEEETGPQPDVYAEYEKGTVTQILMENIWEDEVAEEAWRGEQTLLVEVRTGRYAGESLMVSNAVGHFITSTTDCVLKISVFSSKDFRFSIFKTISSKIKT